MPAERAFSLIKTRNFLMDLIDKSKTPGVPKEIRKRALSCLRHYPGDFWIEELAKLAPQILEVEKNDQTPAP